MLSSILTSTILSRIMYILFNPNEDTVRRTNLEITCNHYLYAWGLPLLISVIPLFTNSYGLEDGDR